MRQHAIKSPRRPLRACWRAIRLSISAMVMMSEATHMVPNEVVHDSLSAVATGARRVWVLRYDAAAGASESSSEAAREM